MRPFVVTTGVAPSATALFTAALTVVVIEGGVREARSFAAIVSASGVDAHLGDVPLESVAAGTSSTAHRGEAGSEADDRSDAQKDDGDLSFARMH